MIIKTVLIGFVSLTAEGHEIYSWLTDSRLFDSEMDQSYGENACFDTQSSISETSSECFLF